MIVHAGLVARRVRGLWRGVLIMGPSGAGKSDLALRALDAGFRLVADDRTLVWTSGGALFGRAPGPLKGLIESRGQGLLTDSVLDFAAIALAAACEPEGVEIERLPDPAFVRIAGVAVPAVTLKPREASAPAKLSRLIEHLGAGPQQGYQADPLGGPHRAGTGDTP